MVARSTDVNPPNGRSRRRWLEDLADGKAAPIALSMSKEEWLANRAVLKPSGGVPQTEGARIVKQWKCCN